jgi:hypothetical protein
MEQQPQPGMEQQPQPGMEQQGQEEEPFDLPAYQFSQDDGEPQGQQGQQGPPPEQETSSGLTLDELMGKKKKPLPSPISKRLNGRVVANGKH